jgi:AraC-like DNA-binding protein
VLPDGSADVVWTDAGEVFVAGPDTGPVERSLPAGAVIRGLRFRPGAAGAALGLPASELRDLRVPLEEVCKGGVADLLRRLPKTAPPSPLVLEAIRRLGRPTSRVRSLSDALFVSERQLRRVFQEAVGYGPKTLDRVLRFQRFLSLRRAGRDLAGAAAELGYADQAHLTRESVRLSGVSPAKLP